MTIGLIASVASAAGISSSSARRVAVSARHRYKVYQIPKRGGGYRIVAQPAREVKALQRSLVKELEYFLPLHAAATAYRRGMSILDNAQLHSNCRYILKLDFEDFFASIGASSLISHLQQYAPTRLSDPELKFITDLTLWDNAEGMRGLCIGAPSSPFLSNSIMYPFDLKMDEICSRYKVNFTRYSDDIALSSMEPNVLNVVEGMLSDLLREIHYPRLRLNQDKRKAVSRAASMRVTGLTLANQGFVTVGRERKRGVRSGVCRYLRGQLSPKDTIKLKGELAFVFSIESDFRRVLIETYGDRVIELFGT